MSPAAASFVIPCRNAGPHLRPMLQSLLAQTRQDFELILVDDASEDDSLALARQVAGERLQIHRNDAPLGLAGNWNRCASLARKPYFCIAHVDDVYQAQYLEKMLQALEQRPRAGLAHCRASNLDADGRSYRAAAEGYKEGSWQGLTTASPKEVYGRLYQGNFIVCPSVLYRREAFERVGPFVAEQRFVLDWQQWLRFLLAGYELLALPEQLIGYRRHAGTVTGDESQSLNRYREELALLEHMRCEGVQGGLLEPDQAPSLAVHRNLLHDVYTDLLRRDGERARQKLAFGRQELPGFRRLHSSRFLGLCARLGGAGAALARLGMSVFLVSRRPGTPGTH